MLSGGNDPRLMGMALAKVIVGWMLTGLLSLDAPIWPLREVQRSGGSGPSKEIYDRIAEEFRTNTCDQGLLLKSLSLAGGDKDKATALYTAERAAILAHERAKTDRKPEPALIPAGAWVAVLVIVGIAAYITWSISTDDGKITVSDAIRKYLPSSNTSSVAVIAPPGSSSDSTTAPLASPSAADLYNTGLSYEKGTGVAQDYTAAMQWYTKAASFNNTAAMIKIGQFYALGRGGVAQSNDQEWAWYQKAAALGDPQAMTEIGVVYQNRAHDYTQAMQWYQKAASAGNPDAFYIIGYNYENGWGVDKSEQTAVAWFQKAADVGDYDAKQVLPGAMYRLGREYEMGDGVAKDYSQAMQWYQKSAAAGNSNAMLEIGGLYMNGWGVPQDYAQSMQWMKVAADAGNGTAMYNLGMAYEHGVGVSVSTDQSVVWYRKAAGNGSTAAADALKRLGYAP